MRWRGGVILVLPSKKGGTMVVSVDTGWIIGHFLGCPNLG